MYSTALRLYGKNDLRLERFELPKLGDDEVLAEIVSNSVCMSDHKAAAQGADHKRVPKDVARRPIIIGHEFCGRIVEVGARWRKQFAPGAMFSIQPALNVPGREHEAPGYSFHWLGGDATHVVIPREVMEMSCLLPYDGDAFFKASLAEPVSCIIGAFNTSYHHKPGEYTHTMGIRSGGALAVLAGAGPMGVATIDYAVHGPRKPQLLVVTDIDQARLDRAAALFSPADAAAHGVRLVFVNTQAEADPVAALKQLNGGKGYDDLFVFAPIAPLLEQASALMGLNGCLNFFAGPSKPDFRAAINFYDVHYMSHHVVGSSGGNTDDLREALTLMSKGAINPAVMVTHVGGLDCAAKTIIDLPGIPGGKKLLYTHVAMPLTAIDDFGRLGERDPFFAQLAGIASRHNGLWSAEAEAFLLANAPALRV